MIAPKSKWRRKKFYNIDEKVGVGGAKDFFEAKVSFFSKISPRYLQDNRTAPRQFEQNLSFEVLFLWLSYY